MDLNTVLIFEVKPPVYVLSLNACVAYIVLGHWKIREGPFPAQVKRQGSVPRLANVTWCDHAQMCKDKL